MSSILKGLTENRDSWDSNMPGYRGDYGGAENFGRRKREWDENDAIDARLRAQHAQKQEYERTGKFWLKLKDSQRHLPAGPFIGKQSANIAAIDLLKKQPELKGNLLITAYGPDEQQGVSEGQIDELSNNTLASYKKKAGADATAADKEGNFKRGDKRMGGIIKATKKEFDNDKTSVSETNNRTVSNSESSDPWGPQGNFAGDRKIEIGGHTIRRIRVDDVVKYFGEKARVLELNHDKNYARISANGKTLNVRLSDLKPLGQGVAEDEDPCWDNYKQIGMKEKNGKKVPNCVPQSKNRPS